MGGRESSLGFSMMCFCFAIRDLFKRPAEALREAGLQPGFKVLDYGCGPGSYAVAAAGLVGQAGRVYAADINLLAVRRVERIASGKGLTNIETIRTDCATGLDDGVLDVVLLYDTFHDLPDPAAVLKELHRVLKPEGVLSFSDHHMDHDDIVARVTGGGLFDLSTRGAGTYTFRKASDTGTGTDSD